MTKEEVIKKYLAEIKDNITSDQYELNEKIFTLILDIVYQEGERAEMQRIMDRISTLTN